MWRPRPSAGEPPALGHVRAALERLDALERALRGLGLLLPAPQALAIYGSLAEARGRLWLAVAALEPPHGRTP